MVNKSLQCGGYPMRYITDGYSLQKLRNIKYTIVKMTNYAFLFINIHQNCINMNIFAKNLKKGLDFFNKECIMLIIAKF